LWNHGCYTLIYHSNISWKYLLEWRLKSSVFVDSTEVMSKGQIMLPKEIHKSLLIDAGDRIMLIYD